MPTLSSVRCCPNTAPRNPKLKILDCTIRDGGICNDWQFSHAFVQQTHRALRDANIDYMEVGYRTQRGLFRLDDVGPWRFCKEEDLRATLSESTMKLSTMVDVGRIDLQSIPPAQDTLIDVIRIATYAHQLEEAQYILDHALEQGYETFMNVMAVSTLTPDEVDKFLIRLAGSGTHNVAIVDSFGSLFPHHIKSLVRQYRARLGRDIKIGVHCHNNQQQAFANSIAAIHEGVDFVDATLHGMGRGAGNCPLELLLMYLNDNRFDIQPLLPLLETFASLKDELRWGYQLPYAMTGHFNLHPRAGIDKMKTQDRNQIAEMYETYVKREIKKRKIV